MFCVVCGLPIDDDHPGDGHSFRHAVCPPVPDDVTPLQVPAVDAGQQERVVKWDKEQTAYLWERLGRPAVDAQAKGE